MKRAWTGAAALVALAAVAAGHGARAEAPSAVGWWVDRGGVPSGVLPAPAVPSGGLFVEGRITGAAAISAVRYNLSDESVPKQLTLRLSSSSGTVVLHACPAARAWAPAQGGEWGQRPGQDCGPDNAKRVAGAVGTDGTTVSFVIGPALAINPLDLVIVPGTDTTTSSPAVFQAAFLPPDATSLTVSRPDAPPAGGPPADLGLPAAPSTPFDPAASRPPAASVESALFQSPDLPATSQTAASGGGVTATTDGTGGEVAARASQRRPEGSSNNGVRRGLAFLVAAVMVGLLVWVNREELIGRAGLVTTDLASGPHGPPSSDLPVIGVARFARPRAGSPPPV